MTTYLSRWFDLPQTRIDAFAEVTEDHQAIHVDPTASGPYDGTIAHGFLTLSMLSAMAYDALPQSEGVSINYGFDRVRFVSAVPSGAKIRGQFKESDVDRSLGYIARKWDVSVEVQGADRPALVAQWITRTELVPRHAR